jgi:HSP20 family protein
MKYLIPNATDFTRARGDIDRLFERFFDDVRAFGAHGEGRAVVRLDVAEYADRYQVRAELPGVDPEQLELELDGANLTLAGTKPRAFADDGDQVLHRETAAGDFRRVVEFPLPVDADGVNARFEHGVLLVDVPKASAARARKIAIQGVEPQRVVEAPTDEA